jgi:prepilin-type processing-associated H-X9-DG protein
VDERFEPTDVEVRRDEGVTIIYADGHVATFDLMTLRRGCPCAECRSLRERGADVWPRPHSPSPLRIEHAAYHGAWGLAVTWNDGHSTGIFPFEALRRLSEV